LLISGICYLSEWLIESERPLSTVVKVKQYCKGPLILLWLLICKDLFVHLLKNYPWKLFLI